MDSESDQEDVENEELQPSLGSKESTTKKLLRQIKVLTLVGMFIICTVSMGNTYNLGGIFGEIILLR